MSIKLDPELRAHFKAWRNGSALAGPPGRDGTATEQTGLPAIDVDGVAQPAGPAAKASGGALACGAASPDKRAEPATTAGSISGAPTDHAAGKVEAGCFLCRASPPACEADGRGGASPRRTGIEIAIRLVRE
ncbi:MAG: hypothetical protein AAF677_04100 [Pseudomonadota bacterium]